MCDEFTQKDVDDFVSRSGVTRRQFGKVSAAAGLAMMLPQVANAQAVTETDVEVTTPDGVADCYFVHPSSGKHPAVLVWPDILGLRPAFRAMGERPRAIGLFGIGGQPVLSGCAVTSGR